MLKVGLIGLGFMGRMHLTNYIRLESEGFPVKLTAICDENIDGFKCANTKGNISIGDLEWNIDKYSLYSDIDKMMAREQLNCIDITLPTYLHKAISIKALNRGLDVLCEKPMALNANECSEMIKAAKAGGRKLMVGHCLRFWPEYEYLKECVEDGRFGKVVSGYFFRGSGTPAQSSNNWLLQKNKSKGCIFDQHIHDIDVINWLFGKPEGVSTIAKNIIQGSGYDIVSTNYIYNDGKVINAQDDWTLNGDYGFQMLYRVNFERGNIIFEKGVVTVNPNDSKGFLPDIIKEMGYYREIKYFLKAIVEDLEIDICTPESTAVTVEIAKAEIDSADRNGKPVML